LLFRFYVTRHKTPRSLLNLHGNSMEDLLAFDMKSRKIATVI
jgi:hypothetical protein